MTLSKGQWVKHPKCPDWGAGEVLEDRGDTVRVLFVIGEKTISRKHVTLELVDPPAGSSRSVFKLISNKRIDTERLRALCNEFHNEMRDNRQGFNDGGMALEVIHDIENDGELSKDTAKRLFAWCHTDRPVYLRGVDLAKRICIEIYNRVPTKDELRAAGYYN